MFLKKIMEGLSFSRKTIDERETVSSGPEDIPLGEWIDMKDSTYRMEGVARGRRKIEMGNGVEARLL